MALQCRIREITGSVLQQERNADPVLEVMDPTVFDCDLVVIGGGINGAAIAADAAGRGLNVLLCEKADLAAATSSWSSKLVHGGLRYLEQYRFGLVRKSLRERNILTAAAPHLIRPIPFQIPLLERSRNPMLVRLGLLLYGNLTGRGRYRPSRSVRYGSDSPLKNSISKGFEYWDAQVDDSRLVILNAMQAARHSAQILTRTECTGLTPLAPSGTGGADGWQANLTDHASKKVIHCKCRAVVNASGPWVSSLYESLQNKPAPSTLRLVKGSHIIVPRLHAGEQAFLLQHHDGRVIFVIPYLDKFSLIGTTDEEFHGDLDAPQISMQETEYLLAVTNRYFRNRLEPDDVVHSYSGVRPLMDEHGMSASAVSREYHLILEHKPAPILSVYGGKVTTCRVLAEEALNSLTPVFPQMRDPWTSGAVLPGGDFQDVATLQRELSEQFDWLPTELVTRLASAYGTLSFELLRDTNCLSEFGICFGADLYQREVDYLLHREWAQTAEDVLWRRSKLGYLFSQDETRVLDNYMGKGAAGTPV